ncbi:diguanylate cyclase [Halomonas aquamarina]|uniref:Diguanylate cyclase n=1 Tax=Vreelandella aquamarina TaxID=77097 RepID=A0ACC5VU14_9GAMM|nr:diguanylate cyclase [Halomonas aquamarina]MBZ5487266.1 diguanylate cyclase [Halomonas aquamarina]
MLNVIKRSWSPGVAGNPSRLRRKIELCNQVGLFGAIATTPYQLFYFFYDFALYRGVFLFNLLFMTVYLVVLLLNHWRWHRAARNVLLVNVCSQLFVVTFFISAGAGVHLFYFTIASILVFLFKRLRVTTYVPMMVLLGVLYLSAHFLFSPGSVPAPVPSPWIDIMYAGSVTGALALLGVFLYLFRKQIDQAEDELTRTNQHLETLSNTDPLTGLANRRVLDETLAQEWARLARWPGALCVIMCDVDHFKLFNDHYGHDGGDRCLREITAALQGVLSRPSDLLVRYGGEEFAVVLPGTDQAGSRYIGEKLRQAVEGLNIPNEKSVTAACVTISVGVSGIDHFSPDLNRHGVDHLLKRADQALYQAKAGGRNRMVFLPYLGASTLVEQ